MILKKFSEIISEKVFGRIFADELFEKLRKDELYAFFHEYKYDLD